MEFINESNNQILKTITRQDGHGIGMISLQNFAKENKATISFSQENGWVTFMMYWVLRK